MNVVSNIIFICLDCGCF